MFEASALEVSDAYDKIADELDCDPADVHDAFTWLEEPLWHRPEDLRRMKEDAKHFEAITKLLSRAHKELGRVTDNRQLDAIIVGGGLSLETLSQMRDGADEMARYFNQYCARFPQRGDKNWAAQIVADGILNLFKALKRPITFGHHEGEPTTQYGRAVRMSMTILKIGSDWREPTMLAVRKLKTE